MGTALMMAGRPSMCVRIRPGTPVSSNASKDGGTDSLSNSSGSAAVHWPLKNSSGSVPDVCPSRSTMAR